MQGLMFVISSEKIRNHSTEAYILFFIELQLLTKKDDLFLKCSQIEALIKNSDDLVAYLKKNVLHKVIYFLIY